ncbi:MAG: chorismate mutase [Bacillota bacterium]
MDNNWLNEARAKLDEIDFEIIDILARRYSIIREIGEFKKRNKIDVMQHDRVKKILERCSEEGAKYNLSKDFIKKLFSLLIEESCLIEEEIIKNSL